MRERRRWARGDLARAMCPVCGDVIAYLDLVRDWRGRYVCGDCDDPPPPALPRLADDAQALEHPHPFLHNWPPPPPIVEQVPANMDAPLLFPDEIVLDGGTALSDDGIVLDGGSPRLPPLYILASTAEP